MAASSLASSVESRTRITSPALANLSLHLPSLDSRSQHFFEAANPNPSLGVVEERRLSQTSSIYDDDDEWNRRISRLTIQPLCQVGNRPDARLTSRETPRTISWPNEALDGQSQSPDLLKAASAAQGQRLEVNRDLRTRNLCVFALVLGILAGIASLAAGCQIVASGRTLLPSFLLDKYINMGTVDYPFPAKTAKHYLSGHRVVPVPEAAMLMIGFVLNVCLTVLFDCMAFIQNTTLRWALCKEGRLVFNSNPRLFIGARHFAPNWRVSNAVSALALTMGYGSISSLTCSIYVVGMSNGRSGIAEGKPITGPRYAIDFSGWGFIGLGISLLLQGSISSWCLSRSKIVPTWSSNPFNTALICALLGLADKNRTKKPKLLAADAIMSAQKLPNHVEAKPTWLTQSDYGEGITLAVPQRKQLPMRLEVPHSSRFTYFAWAVFAVIVLWILVITTFGMKTRSCTSDYVDHMAHRLDFLAFWQNYCQVTIPYYVDPFFNRRDWLGLIIQCAVFSFITLGLHCAELLTDIARDESAWRKATTTGADAGRGALIEGATSWVCWLMFAFKSIAPWMFSMAFNTNLVVFNNLIPLSVLGLIMLSVALFSEYLLRWQPKGPQPCVYGNISKLASLVDEWHPRIFWGDKGMIDDKVRRAGTAGRRLADVDMSMLYANLRV
ncbi:uncharacterized protein PV09_06109 [Verruconis gallopava]|uniref:Uncharacterized protein n=1 Tax=Verruconis gallopava TaxID=253628 RepID=A0A0D1YPX7_9PEZI|nr:uncharacterized protein PV09_06109 [Verruconis gallopava]KIW02672.1 hypothetical protein PV09_06109 [Verruconis gallopava]